jgi:hypothetical protein
MEGHHQAVYKGKSGATLQELGPMRTAIKGVVPYAPGLQGGSGNLKRLSRLTLRDPLSLQLKRVLKQVSSLETVPARLALRVALSLVLDDGSHSDLLCQSHAFS